MTEPAAPSRTRVFLHIGCRKSGTTSLQRAFRISVDELAEQGVNLPYPTREEHIRHQVRPVREFLRTGSEGARARAETSVAELAERIRAEPEMTHLLTLETLAEWPKEGADILVGGLSEFEVHVVVTARDLFRQIPAEWQQTVKTRSKVAYASYLEALRTSRDGHFWMVQDVAAVADRWGRGLPPERVHVVTVPPSSAPRELLVERFFGVLGVDPATVETNMVVLDDVEAPVVAEAAKAQGVLVSRVSPRRIRLVTHLDVDRAAVDRAADVLAELLDR